MNAKDLELKIAGLEKAIQEKTTDASRLKDYNKIALPPAVFDDIYEAVESGVDKFDFSDTDNFEIEYGINYDGKVNCDHHELCNSDDLVQMIVDKVSELFVEKLDTTEADNHA